MLVTNLSFLYTLEAPLANKCVVLRVAHQVGSNFVMPAVVRELANNNPCAGDGVSESAIHAAR